MELPNLNKSDRKSITKLRVIVAGSTLSGKTSVVKRFGSQVFNERVETTIGASLKKKKVLIDNENVEFELWEVGGLERYRYLYKLYYAQACAALVFYDVTENSSYLRALDIIAELKTKGAPKMLIILVGNKVDLQMNREVSMQTVESFAIENGLIFMETSAKTGFNIEELFDVLGSKCLEIQKTEKEALMRRKSDLKSSRCLFRSCFCGTKED